MANCPSCGAPVEAHLEKCPYCGTTIQAAPAAATPPTTEATQQPRVKKNNRSKTVAAILAFFFGAFGVHLFYLGDNNKGLIYLLVSLFTCVGSVICEVLSLVHMIQYLTMSDEEFDEKYNY